MAKKPIKPWISFAEQLQQLQDRGLRVDEKTPALDYLERLGYYRLSGYWYPLRAIDTAASKAQNKAVKRFKELLGNEFPRCENELLSLVDFGVCEGWEGWDLWRQK